ncbi:MAG: hypothetical protein ACRD68_10770 [Pyrinomonadaceae bacterium]
MPPSSVVAVFSTPLASAAVTVAPMMTPPRSSVTCPRSVPEDCCAKAPPVIWKQKKTTASVSATAAAGTTLETIP